MLCCLFCIARLLIPGDQTSTYIRGAGTPGYAPVEQVSGAGSNPQSDIYAFGATLYRMLTRSTPPTSVALMTGQETPDAGTLRVGESVVIGYVDQSRDTLDPAKNVWEEISGGLDVLELGKRTMQSRAYVGAFNFKGGDQQKKVGNLSGGERNRVHLAKMLKSGANLLLLDEPTNDLDVETLRALEAALEDFAGCAMIISHDRWFLDRIATHMLAFEGDSHVEWFEGNFQDYEADKKRRLGVDADQPHKLKYKRFARA